ncbi:unnamed protein product [Chondrus crispus]|uniref:SSD domain-containing protein n=1 Tax=Chondrus crispus TaxID=2769 RepID=S0F2Z9_CHOCR|nr:unnamed protein product [Chondrus crispus]CDF77551.1 unnamed protein product [Chondrus crispus]|eukprot:XP_005717335.1 unnamed protein product [Chondrus crispus]
MVLVLHLFSRFSLSISAYLRAFFYRFAHRIARNPYRTLILFFCLSPILLVAVLRLDSSLPADKVYSPSNALAAQYRRYVRRNFGLPDRRSSLLFRNRDSINPSIPLDSQPALRDMVKFLSRSFRVDTSSSRQAEGNFWRERCVKAFDQEGNPFCFSLSFLDVFYNASKLVRDSDGNPHFFDTIDAQLRIMTDDNVRRHLNQGKGVSWNGLPSNMNNVVARNGDGRVVALVFHTFFYEEPTEKNAEVLSNPDFDAFDRSWLEAVRVQNDDDSLSVTALPDCRWSRHDSSETAAYKELVLFPIGFFLLTAYVCFFLGELHPVYSRVGLGLVAILTCALAIGATIGLAALLKLPFTSVHYVLLLLLTGIGIDDIMVITRALAHVDRNLKRDGTGDSVPDKIGQAMSSAGASILTTTATNTAVFLASASTSLRGFRSFALWAAIGVVLTFIYTSTFFVAALALDQRRIEKGQKDIYCLYRRANKIPEKNFAGLQFQAMSRFFRNILGPFITRPSISAVVIVLFGILSGAGIWGTTRLSVKFDSYHLYMHQTPAWKFSKTFVENFNVGQPAHVYVRGVDFSKTDSQELVLRLCHPTTGLIARNKWVEEGSVSCWLHALREAKNIPDSQNVILSEDFVEDVIEFFGFNPRFLYSNEVVLKRDRTIKASRFSYTRKHVESVREEVKAMTDIRNELQQVLSGDEVFSFSDTDLLTEQYAVLRTEMAIATGIACGAVFVVCSILSGHPIIGAVCVTLVGLIVVDVIGICHFTGYDLNAVTLIVITVSVGIGVDFVLHIGRSFQDQVGTRKERAVLALQELGPSIFHAGMSTFFSILVPGMSRSYIFRTLFWGLFSLLILAVLHGLILGPILLSLVGPKGWYNSIEMREDVSGLVLGREGQRTDLREDDNSAEIEEGRSGKKGEVAVTEKGQEDGKCCDSNDCDPGQGNSPTSDTSHQTTTENHNQPQEH